MKYQIIDNQKADGCLEGVYTFEELKKLVTEFVRSIAENDYDYYTTGDYTMPKVETLNDIIKILADDYYTLKIIGA